MATTTNYSWTTPDDTALVKDGASAIRSLGTSIDTTTKNLNPSTTLGDIEYRSSTANTNTRLGIGSSGQGLQVVGGVPSWAATSTSTLTTTGDLLYASAANTLARRAIGTTGQVLTVSGGLPTWSNPAGGGKVLQVVQGTTTTVTTISSTTYADTTLTATITPTASTSKILVMFAQVSSTARNSTEAGSGIRLVRGATTVYNPAPNGYETQYIYGSTIGTSGTNIKHLLSGSYLDSPATTSATTYKTQGCTHANTSSPSVQYNDGISTMILMEIGA